jgi:hypothetical protein
MDGWMDGEKNAAEIAAVLFSEAWSKPAIQRGRHLKVRNKPPAESCHLKQRLRGNVVLLFGSIANLITRKRLFLCQAQA